MRAFADNRYAHRAGWSYALRRSALPPDGADGLTVHVIAKARNGNRLLIGKRQVSLSGGDGAFCHVRCHKPFDSLYIDARAHVYPYPDCHTDQPFGDTAKNLKSAIHGETYEYTEMYPGMAKTARGEKFEEIAEWFETLAKAEKSHAGRFQKALDQLEKL